MAAVGAVVGGGRPELAFILALVVNKMGTNAGFRLVILTPHPCALLIAAYCSLFMALCSWLIAHCSLLIAHCSLLIAALCQVASPLLPPLLSSGLRGCM